MSNALKKLLGPVLVVLIFGIAVFLLYRNLRQYDFAELVAAVTDLPKRSLAMGIGWAAASYLCLTGFDYLGLRYAGRPLPYRVAARTSFMSLSIGHTLGMSFLSSGAIRYRFYSLHGLAAEDVAKVILFCGITVGLGLAILASAALTFQPEISAELMGVSSTTIVILAVAAAAVPLIYLALCAFVRGKIKIWKVSLEMPHVWLALPQLVIAPLNFACVAACLYSVMAAVSDLTYPATAAIFVLANIAWVVSHVPGGLGVLENVILYLVPGAKIVAALLAFRFIYFLLPLSLGGLLFAFSEIRLRTASKAETQLE